MAILVNQNSRVILQGSTGRQGRFHLPKLLDYGVEVIGGVSPGKGGQEVSGVRIFDTVKEAVPAEGVDVSMIMVPPAGVLSAAVEAISNRIPLIVIITEHVPFHDSLKIRGMATAAGLGVIGPNTVGVTSPGKCKVSVSPASIFMPGNVGVISRSGTLTHEVASILTCRGIGQSTCVCIGGDRVKTLDFIDLLKRFREDDETDTVIMIGEIGGTGEELAATYIEDTRYPKQVIAYIAGATAPPEKKMGHSGAIISHGTGTAASKTAQLEAAGVCMVKRLDDVLDLLVAAPEGQSTKGPV